MSSKSHTWRKALLRVAASILWLSLLLANEMSFGDELRFKTHVVNAKTDFSAAALSDVNGDGKLDIICGSHWYENPTWKPHFIANIPIVQGRPDGFSHLPFDVNRDGHEDIITINYRSRSIKWVLHPGSGPDGWKVQTALEPGATETGRLVDVDGDGRLDILAHGGNYAAWWEFDWSKEYENGVAKLSQHDLPKELAGHGMGFGDIDGDGRADVVGQSGWASAPKDRRRGRWRWHAEFRLERASIPMLIVDADSDGDNDILWCSAHGYGVYWLEQIQDSRSNRKWNRHAIDTSWSQGHSLLWADLDNDGQNELIAGKRYLAHEGKDPGAYDPVAIYRYQFDGLSKTWHRYCITEPNTKVSFGLDPKVGDIDGDGDLDLLTSGRSGIYWLENVGNAKETHTATNRVPYKEALATKIAADWGMHRSRFVKNIEAIHGSIPNPRKRTLLNTEILESNLADGYWTKRVRYRIAPTQTATATLLVPEKTKRARHGGVVCMHESGTDLAVKLVKRGIVCVVPEIEFASNLDTVWQAMRAADLLQSLDAVHGERLGFAGELKTTLSLNPAMYDQRFIATYIDTSSLKNSSGQPETAMAVASIAPRSMFMRLPNDADEKHAFESSVYNAMSIFKLRKASKHLIVRQQPASGNDSSELVDWFSRKLSR